MVKLAIVALAAACLAAVVLAQRPPDQPWGGLVVEDDSRQDPPAPSSWATILTNLISGVIAPLLQNVATGITNAITATFANRTLRYIPLPNVPAEPIYKLPSPPRPYGGDDYPSFYREPSSKPPGAESYRRRPASGDTPENTK